MSNIPTAISESLLSSRQARTLEVAHCPFCDHPRRFLDGKSHERKTRRGNTDVSARVFACKNCTKTFAVEDSFSSTIDAVEAFEEDEHGDADEGWVRCPRCKIIISKGDGCWHMTCVCGEEFYWDEELEKQEKSATTKKYTLAKIRRKS